MLTLAHYTGGIHGYGTMVFECAHCGEIIAEYNCDDDGKTTNCIFDIRDTHECPEVEDDEYEIEVKYDDLGEEVSNPNDEVIDFD